MRKSIKQLISVVLAVSIIAISVSPLGAFAQDMDINLSYESPLDGFNVNISENTAYSVDFTQLVKNGADTTYGSATDIINLDDYTTAYLTYAGTYVDASGVVHLTGSGTNKGNGQYVNGSYIEFTAPEDGDVSFQLDYANYFVDSTYKGYSSTTVALTAGQKLCIGSRKSDRSTVTGLTFTSATVADATPTPSPTVDPSYVAGEYTSPSSMWDFDTLFPAYEGHNKPVISGTAIWDSTNGEVKFDSGTTTDGYLNVDFESGIKNNVEISFDTQGHVKALGQQYINYSVLNSEGEELVNYSVHPYDNNSNSIKICGVEVASGADASLSIDKTNIKTSIDYNARAVTVTVGSDSFRGEIPESVLQDVKSFEFSVSRTKTEESRYISLDNLKISEFTSTATPAPAPTITNGFAEGIYDTLPYRVMAPVDYGSKQYPLIVYLHGELRNGTDNYNQLYNAQYLFNEIGASNAILVAPQSNGEWSKTTLKGFVESIDEAYNADSDKIYLVGQSDSVAACYDVAAEYPELLAAIVPIAGTVVLTDAQVTSIADSNTSVYAFSDYPDEDVAYADIRNTVNLLQTKKMTEVNYTEYPYDGNKIEEKASKDVAAWLLKQSKTKNARKETKTVDLVLFSGQSNMAGRGDYNIATECGVGEGYEYHSVTEPAVLSTVEEPFGKYENNDNINDAGSNGKDRRNGDMVSSIMKAYYDKTGVPIVGVQASRGGTNTSWWKTSIRYNEAIARYKEAEEYLTANGFTVRKKFMVWCQGESDADLYVSDDTYKSNTLAVFNAIKSGTGITDAFIVKTGHYNTILDDSDTGYAADDRYRRINQAQSALAYENENVYVAANLFTDEYMEKMIDAYHFNQEVYNEVGTTAGSNIASIYAGESAIVPTTSPVKATPNPEVTLTPTMTPPPTDDAGVNLNFDFSSDQTGTENNVPVISGTASYDSINQNIKFDASNKSTGEVKIDLNPTAVGVITVEFDARITQLGQQYFNYKIADSVGKEMVYFTFDAYNNAGSLKIGGVEIATPPQFSSMINSYKGDGMGVAATHFKTEINYPKGVATVTISKNATENIEFTGSISSTVNNVSLVSISKTSSKTADRHMYVDNISISSYTPAASIYAVGSNSITKKLGETVTEQYTVSKSYTDKTDEIEWSVEGVDGVTIDKDTGVLTVLETAKTGIATVTLTLTKSNTLTVGTTDSIDVQIKDFAKKESHKLGGATTIEKGGSTKFTLDEVLNVDGDDITEFAKISAFVSDNTSVAEVSSDGTVMAKGAGFANISFTLAIEKLGVSESINVPVTVGVYEITSSKTSIDVSSLISYGNTNYRMYKADGTYEDVTATNGIVSNTSSNEVTIVSVYRFEFTNLTSSTDKYINGYVKAANGSYDSSGFGLVNGINYNINENGVKVVDERPIRVNIPYGSYDMNIYRKGGARADIYCDGYQIVNNTTSASPQNRSAGTALYYAPQVKVLDGTADITFKNISGDNERIASVEIIKVPDKYKKRVIWIAGDSESANYYALDADGDDLNSDKIMFTGFGTQLPKFLSDDYKIANFGQPSATVKTWYDECFESVSYRMEKGDTIIIDFGINEVVSSSNKLSEDEMKSYMKEISDVAKEKGVQPILVSPVYNNKYDSKSYFTYKNETNNMYAFAEEIGIPCIDLNKGTRAYKDDAISSTGDSSWLSLNYHIADNLHLNQFSALMAAAIIAGGMEELGYETTNYAYTYKDISAFDTSDSTLRGKLSGVERVYSIDALSDYVTVLGEEYIIIPTPSPSDGKIKISYNDNIVTLTDPDLKTDTAVIIVAKYNNDESMQSVNTYDAEFKNGAATVTDIMADGGEKIFVWDSLKGMKPLSYEYVVPMLTPTPIQTPIPTPTPSDEPVEMLYSEDFESYAEGDSGGWTSPAGTMAIKTDSTDGINKYQTVQSGKSGTARSGYVEIANIDENFVFECDFKSSAYDNVSELQLVESKSSIYANHGCYSNAKFAFEMDRPRKENLYVINNLKSDSGMLLSSYVQPAVVTKEIEGDPWLHVKVVGNFETGTAIAYITSLDGETEYYHGMTDMKEGIKSFKCIHLLSPAKGYDTCIDNIKIYKARQSDLAPKYHKVTLICKAYTFDQYVLDGESVVNIPDVSSYGEHFKGWTIGDNEKLHSNEELAIAPITADCEVKGNIGEGYIENMASVEFNSFPANNELIMGEDENTYGDNPISLTILGEQGTSLVTSPDSRVTDYEIEWTFDGFRILDGRETNETGSNYCEGYGLVEVTKKAQTEVNFKLKKTTANYYGIVRAKVRYNGNTIQIEKPLLLLGDKTQDSSIFLPKAGYTSDYNKYDSALAGYYTSGSNDVLTGGWSSAGSDSVSVAISEDTHGKYLRLTRALSGNSAYIYQSIGQISEETVFSQDVRFENDATISYMNGTVTESRDIAFNLAMSSGNLKLNNLTVCTAQYKKWYHIEIIADPTSKLCYAKIYDYNADGIYSEPVATSTAVAFDGTYTSGNYYRITLSKDRTPVDINNVRIYASAIDEASMEIIAPESANIPEADTETVEFVLNASTVDKNLAIGKAEWSIDDEFATGVTIKSTGANSATLTITDKAQSGELPIRATIAGKSVVYIIKLLGTKDNVAFLKAPTGILIGEESADYEFSAVVRNGQAEEVSEREISYALYDKDNLNEVTASGVTIDSNTGVMTVLPDAKAQIIGVRATSNDADGNEISKFIRVNIYNLKFNFGASDVVDGYIPVNSSVIYSDSRGFGIEGTATDDSDGSTLADTSITGNDAVFKVKLEKGKVYKVTAKYNGTLRCEKIDLNFVGFDKTRDSMGDMTYSVAIFGDDIMDITLRDTTALASLQITELSKEKTEKPQWWTIGDSTVQQNGSWGYTISNNYTNDLSKYPELAKVVSGFHNSGKAGEHHKNFYSNGRLNAILTEMNIGDVVSLGAFGTNDSSSTYEDFKYYDEVYLNAILDMGGYAILHTYTPGKTDKLYDADNMEFKGARTNPYETAIRTVYEENKENPNVLGFIEIGKMTDEKLTSDVKAAYEAVIDGGGDESAAREAADKKAEEFIAWWKDYNHYYVNLSDYILPDLTNLVAQLISSIPAK